MRGSGVDVVRVAVYWDDLQPTEGVARTSPPRRDRHRGHLPRPAGGAGRPPCPAVGAGEPADIASPPRNPYEYARFMTALVARFGPRGTLWVPGRTPVVPIREWQIWNEPNLTRYWNQAPLRPVLRAAAGVARAALCERPTRGAQVVLAGLPNQLWKALRQLYEAGGRGHFDVVALHPYTGQPATWCEIIRLARREMRPRGDGASPCG